MYIDYMTERRIRVWKCLPEIKEKSSLVIASLIVIIVNKETKNKSLKQMRALHKLHKQNQLKYINE